MKKNGLFLKSHGRTGKPVHGEAVLRRYRMSDEELLETLKLDSEEGRITKRNRKRVESLREKSGENTG